MATNYRTLTDSVMQQTGTMPLVDAHMHIQGNDIAPIPIMRGIAVMSLNIEKRLNNKIINYEELSYLVPNDKVDPVPGFFAGGIRESDIAVALVTLFTFLKGERQRLTDLTAMLMDYGKVARHPSYLSAGVYMNDVIKTTMGMASHASKREITDSNRKKSEDERTKLVTFRKSTEGEFQDAARHYYLLASGENSPSIGASFQFSICLGMELMYAHYWGAYGIPIYIPIKDKLYFPINELNLDVSYSTPTGYKSDTVRLHHAYDLPNQSIESAFEIWEGETKKSVANKDNLLSLASLKPFDTNSVGKTEKYSLFLAEVDSREAWQFEDHGQHVTYMKMAALKYPFKILPFYHLDARRFFAPSDSASLDKTHNFYIQKNTKLNKVPASEIVSAMEQRKNFTFNMDIDDVKQEILPGGGVFFGVKLYMALGYPPYIGEGNYGKNPFPALSTESYAGFKDFLAH